MDVFALTLYDILLFPNFQGYVDYVAIYVFFAIKSQSGSLVTAILADTYVTLNLCRERKVKKLPYYQSTLYVWLISRTGKRDGWDQMSS